MSTKVLPVNVSIDASHLGSLTNEEIRVRLGLKNPVVTNRDIPVGTVVTPSIALGYQELTSMSTKEIISILKDT